MIGTRSLEKDNGLYGWSTDARKRAQQEEDQWASQVKENGNKKARTKRNDGF